MTAYECRISDWSSDVCSSDLRVRHHGRPGADPVEHGDGIRGHAAHRGADDRRYGLVDRADADRHTRGLRAHQGLAVTGARSGSAFAFRRRRRRSEEHTSELQSLMRISYAVFCWDKKKINN